MKKIEHVQLEKLREEINLIDMQMFALLKKRFLLVEKVGVYKKLHDLPVRNKKREHELIEVMSKKSKLDKNFVTKFYRVIFNNSYKLEK